MQYSGRMEKLVIIEWDDVKSILMLWDRMKIYHKKVLGKAGGKNSELFGSQLTLEELSIITSIEN